MQASGGLTQNDGLTIMSSGSVLDAAAQFNRAVVNLNVAPDDPQPVWQFVQSMQLTNSDLCFSNLTGTSPTLQAASLSFAAE